VLDSRSVKRLVRIIVRSRLEHNLFVGRAPAAPGAELTPPLFIAPAGLNRSAAIIRRRELGEEEQPSLSSIQWSSDGRRAASSTC
jgi:hypothetical protein